MTLPSLTPCCAAGTAEELRADPDNHLRLTVGLRKQAGRWVVIHEHHSFSTKS
jgi:ketosteroid isomerase-like protein